jgi:hypothetical protein
MRVGNLVFSTIRLVCMSLVGAGLVSCNGADNQVEEPGAPPVGGITGEGPASAAAGSPEETASVSLALTNVPSDALCLELTVAPTGGTIGGKTQLFDLTPGASSVNVTLDGLPAGGANLSARGFGVACAQVQASSKPTWVSAGSVPLTLVAGQTATASLTLRKPSAVQVNATFDDGKLVITSHANDFGATQVGGTINSGFTLTNTGTTTVSLSAPTITGADASQFLTAGNPCPSINPGQSCTFIVSFKPTSTGTKTATVMVNTASAPLAGHALPAGSLTLTPNPANFPNTAVNSVSTLTLTVTNSTATEVSLIGGFGTNSDGFSLDATCPYTLPGFSSCYLTISFRPIQVGPITGSLYSPIGDYVPLTGIATAILTPVSKDFGATQVGGTITAGFNLANPTFVTIPMSAPTITGADASQFSVSGPGCPSINPEQSCTFIVSFTPTSTGLKNGSPTVLVGART